jgi:phosphonate transport system ATP-binding protein
MREVTATLDIDEASELLARARTLARTKPLLVLASLDAVDAARTCADRILVLTDGLLVFDGPAAAFTDEVASRHLPALAASTAGRRPL